MKSDSSNWKLVPAAFSIALCFATPAISGITEITEASHTRHWLANTGGTLDNHVQNFITDMILYNWEQSPQANPLLITASFWDEGHCGYCSYNTQNGGAQFGKTEWWKDTIHSDRAYFYDRQPGKTPVLQNKCQIEKFWGRNFQMNQGPPPQDSLPFVSCTNGDTIYNDVVEDPSALTFDNSGNLLVADNGPDQDIKIFAPGNPSKPIRTFGDKGGVFARLTKGDSTWLPGQVGSRRFWGIRGLAVDSLGNVYVGNTGLPMQTMGGTDIRAFKVQKNAFTGYSDTTFSWQQQGLAFVNTADADPVSEGRDVYLNAKRFRMDYSKTPGKSWALAAVTLDPFKYPKDPRLSTPMETEWIRRVGGKKVQYNTNMYGEFVYVARFTDTSEIAIPTAYICNYGDPQTVAWADTLPTWIRNETNKKMRWYWIDQNGDGIPQSKEFGIWETWGVNNQGVDIDDQGNIWFGGRGDASTQINEGGITMIPVNGLLGNGVPNIRPDSALRYSVPFEEDNGYVPRLKYIASKDRMYLATSPNTWYSSKIYVYDNYRKSQPTKERCVVDIGFDDNGQSEIHLDQGTDVMTIPFSFTADSEYIYVGYLDNGRYSRRRGEVTIYDSKTCQPVGWMAPGKDMDYFAGTIDMVNGLNVSVLSNGDRVVFEEEDGAGKVIAFKWTPVAHTASVLPGAHSATLPKLRWRDNGLGIDGLAGSGINSARWVDISGREIGNWSIPNGVSEFKLPLSGRRGSVQSFVELSGPDGKQTLRTPPPF
jgi:hypothetical protein